MVLHIINVIYTRIFSNSSPSKYSSLLIKTILIFNIIIIYLKICPRLKLHHLLLTWMLRSSFYKSFEICSISSSKWFLFNSPFRLFLVIPFSLSFFWTKLWYAKTRLWVYSWRFEATSRRITFCFARCRWFDSITFCTKEKGMLNVFRINFNSS